MVALLFTCESSHGQYGSFYGGGGSSSGESTTKTGFALSAGYVLYHAELESAGAEPLAGDGTGYRLGLELNSTSNTPKGLWILGLYYSSFTLEWDPNGVHEVDTFQNLEAPLSWGFYIGRFLFSAGLKTRYGLATIARKREGTSSTLSHQAFGIKAMQLEGFGTLRYVHSIRRKPRFFIEYSYGQGLFDRALGEVDHWRDGTSSASFGVLF